MRISMNDNDGSTQAIHYQINEIRKLFKLKKNSAVITIIKDTRLWMFDEMEFKEIRQALEE